MRSREHSLLRVSEVVLEEETGVWGSEPLARPVAWITNSCGAD